MSTPKMTDSFDADFLIQNSTPIRFIEMDEYLLIVLLSNRKFRRRSLFMKYFEEREGGFFKSVLLKESTPICSCRRNDHSGE